MVARAIALVVAISLLAPAASATSAEQRMTLVCHFPATGARPERDLTFEVDYQRQTVNGAPAKITDAQIYWEIERDGTKYTQSFNRYSGRIELYSASTTSGHSWMYTGDCVRAGQKEF